MDDWGSATPERVEDFVKDIQNMGCPYDQDNLRWSGEAVLGSISLDLWQRIEKELPTDGDVTGPQVLAAIVSHMQQVNSSGVRQPIKSLEGMQLK